MPLPRLNQSPPYKGGAGVVARDEYLQYESRAALLPSFRDDGDLNILSESQDLRH